MPVQEFALDAAGNYVQVFLSDESENVTVLLNRSIIGVIPSREELRTAREFALPDGSTLRVQLVGTQLQVFRDGQLLSQNPYGVPPQGPYSQPQAPYGYGAPPQGPYGAFAYQQPGYGFGTPPVQAAPLPLGEAIRQLPKQYIKVLTKRSAATFAEEQGKASWGSVWVQLICYVLVVAVLEYLANVISQTGSSDLALIVAIFIVVIPIGFFIIGGIYYLIARAFGGQGTFLAHIYAMLLYSVPLGTLAALLSLIPGFGSRLADIVSGGYGILLGVCMIMGVHRLSGGKATAVILTPVAVIVLIVVLANLVRG